MPPDAELVLRIVQRRRHTLIDPDSIAKDIDLVNLDGG